MIAGVQGRVQKRTLKNFCHDKEPTKENGLHKGCPLYDTKPENTPAYLYPAIEAAEELRELKEIGLLPSIHELSAWEVCCYKVAEMASRVVEAEAMKEITSKGSDKQTPFGELGQEQKEGGAFSDW